MPLGMGDLAASSVKADARVFGNGGFLIRIIGQIVCKSPW